MSGQELQKSHTPDDFGHFFKGWIRNPLAMGAFAPSGKSLAKLMAKDVGAGSRVIELGAGTGTVTEALLANGVAPSNLYVVERDPQFVKILERRFPRCHVIAADALALALPFDAAGAFDFVISGLPLLCFSPDKRYRALREALQLAEAAWPLASIHLRRPLPRRPGPARAAARGQRPAGYRRAEPTAGFRLSPHAAILFDACVNAPTFVSNALR